MDRNYTTFSDARDPDPIDKFIDQAIAADAAAHAADAAAHARRETLKQCADIVRKHFPRPPRSYVRVIT